MDELERSVGAQNNKVQRWASVAAVPQASENSDTAAESQLKWSKIYKLFGASGETEQDEVFAAVNAYFLRNGASPNGRYSKPIRTAGGKQVQAGEVVKITGRLEGEIRQFLRGRLEDSYNLLKHNPMFKDDEVLAASAEGAGVPRGMGWLTADWLGQNCVYFVGEEHDVYAALRTSKIANAYNKRAASQPGVDRVLESAPESKIVNRASPVSHDQGLF